MTIGTSMSRLLGTSGGGAKNTAQTEADLNSLFDSDEEPNSDEERLRCVRPNNSSPAPSGEWNHLYDVNFPIFKAYELFLFFKGINKVKLFFG